MNRKLISLLIIISGLIILIGVIYIIFFYDFSPQDQILTEERTAQQTENKETEEQIVKLPTEVASKTAKSGPEISRTDITREDLKRMALSFTERFGSYSNHSNYSNIIDLKIFMSKQMQVWADNYVNKFQAEKEYSSIYYGITTKAIQAEIKKFNDESQQAEVLVKTKRRESTGTMSNFSTFYQDIIITFIEEGGVWKVDNAYWQTK